MNTSPIKIIVTGATGMVGEGVLMECLNDSRVAEVLIVNRRPSGFNHPKLKEVVHTDFFDLSAIEAQLSGYDACYFCLGVSSVGMDADTYYKLTYALTLNFAQTVSRVNPGMIFTYVSGSGTDRTEQGKLRWARVKGKTENDLARLPFKAEYNFRPGGLIAAKGAKNIPGWYNWLAWLVKLVGVFMPNGVSTLKQLGEAMLQVTFAGFNKQDVEVKDIKELSAQYQSAQH